MAKKSKSKSYQSKRDRNQSPDVQDVQADANGEGVAEAIADGGEAPEVELGASDDAEAMSPREATDATTAEAEGLAAGSVNLDADAAIETESETAEMLADSADDVIAHDDFADDELLADGIEADDSEADPTAPVTAAALADDELKCLIEALIFAADKPVTLVRLRQLTRVADVPRLQRLLGELAEAYQTRGIVLQQVSGGYQFRTRSAYSSWVQQLIAGRPVRLSRAQLETLAIIAYRQPITRPEIDDIRGVDSGGTLKVLLDRALIRILGKKEEPGRPMLYGTTKEFLDFFSLGDLRELPTLREYSELNSESRATMKKFGFDGVTGPIPATADISLDASAADSLIDSSDATSTIDAETAMESAPILNEEMAAAGEGIEVVDLTAAAETDAIPDGVVETSLSDDGETDSGRHASLDHDSSMSAGESDSTIEAAFQLNAELNDELAAEERLTAEIDLEMASETVSVTDEVVAISDELDDGIDHDGYDAGDDRTS